MGDNNTDGVRDLANVGLALRENAYDFVNASLREAEAAADEPKRWKFAIVHVAQALELLLKARLADEHALLVMGNVDKPGRLTIGFDKALDRLATCGVTLQHEDLHRLRAARALRNDLTHFHAVVSDEELRAAFIDLFEFSHVFHLRELDSELHEHVEEELWPSEADMMEAFRSDLVTYQGAEMVPHFAAQIVAAQYYREVEIDGERYERIPCGDPRDLFFGYRVEGSSCNDCAVRPGQLHTPGCDAEACPRCREQIIGSCECDWSAEFAGDKGEA